MARHLLMLVVLILGSKTYATTDIPVIRWEGDLNWTCETEEDAIKYRNGFVVALPKVELVRCEDELGSCLEFKTPVRLYECTRKELAKYPIVRVSRNRRMVVQVLPFEAYRNDKLAIRGPFNPETNFADWKYINLSDIGIASKTTASTNVGFDFGMTEALKFNHIDKDKAVGKVLINAKWHWMQACTQELDHLPCPEISAGAGTPFYISHGWFDMDLEVDLNQLGPVQVQKFQYRAQ